MNNFILITDSSSSILRSAIYKDSKQIACIEKNATPLENFFPILNELFKLANCSPKDIGEFWFCQGPGSVLGIRSASVSFATFASLSGAKLKIFDIFSALASCAKERNLKAPFTLYCGSKKGFYNLCNVSSNYECSYKEVENCNIEKELLGNLYFIKQRNKEDELKNSEIFTYTIDELFKTLSANKSILKDVSETPDALLLSKREFVKWNSQVRI